MFPNQLNLFDSWPDTSDYFKKLLYFYSNPYSSEPADE